MGKKTGGGGRRVSSARAASTTQQNAYDIARNALRDMGNVRITTSSFNTVVIETTGSTAARSTAKMRAVEARLKPDMARSTDRQVVEPFDENRWHWVSEFRRR